jgi:large subunit ribosomal protein L9
MKIIFLDNVKGVGRKGEVKNVADGYYLNFLAPRKLAKLATDDAIKAADARKKKEVMDKERIKEDAKMVQSRLNGLHLEVKGKAQGMKLYASVTVDDLIKLLVEKVKMRLEKSNFQSGLHLKEIGMHDVEVKLPDGLKATLKVEIKADPS